VRTFPPAHVNVVVSLSTLLGLDDAAAEIPGHGFITAAHARQVALTAGSIWRRLVLVGSSPQTAPEGESWGTIALAVLGGDVSSCRLTWARRSWGGSLLDFWDDFSDDGQLDEPAEGARVPTGSLVVTRTLPAGASAEMTFVIAWHFPNRRGWSHTAAGPPNFSHSDDIVGNHYATLFADAADVVRRLASRLPDLERRTIDYVRTVTGSDLPVCVQDAVLSSVAVLKSTTCFRIADGGAFLGWEGSNPDHGSCHGSCTHVWNYQYALEQLFPDLAWTRRRVELVDALDERGMMSFRVGLPLASEGTGWRVGAADGQMGALVRLHRTWLLSGDHEGHERLAELWPQARAALAFAWVPGGWDADEDGLMEGCQHNTMDVEYYDPNGVGQSWYLAALAAGAAMADAVGDLEFATKCRTLLRSGATLTDTGLFNGAYYQQEIIAPGSDGAIADGLRIRYAGDTPDMGSDDLQEPDFQLGSGCPSDQLAGHAMALLGGLDDRLDRTHVRTALDSIVTNNHRDDFSSHVNHLRSYALGSDRGLVNATFPRGGRPTRPSPYVSEVWTGLEYTAALGLAVIGERDRAARIVEETRPRHDGRTRTPSTRSSAETTTSGGWPPSGSRTAGPEPSSTWAPTP